MEINELMAGLDEAGGYQALIPEDATYGATGEEQPLRGAKGFESLPKDIGGLVKRQLEMEKLVGSGMRWPGDGDEEALVKFRADARERGILPTPPADAAGYVEALKTVELPEGMVIDEQAMGAFAEVALRHGIPAEALAEMAPLQAQMMGAAVETLRSQLPGMSVTDEQRAATLAQLKADFPDDFNERMEGAARLRDALIPAESQELMGLLGIGDNPKFLGALMKLSKAAGSDSSFMADLGVGAIAMSRDDAREMVNKAMTDTADPMHKEYKGNTKRWKEFNNEIYGGLEGAKDTVQL